MTSRESEYEQLLVKNIKYNRETGEFTHATTGQKYVKGDPAGSIGTQGYLVIGIRKKKYPAHRVAWFLGTGAWPKQDIDHINGDRLDNRLCNLRDVPRRVNRENMRKAPSRNKSSGLLGVSRHKRDGLWIAKITTHGNVKILGYFKDKMDAHNAYVSAKRILHEGCSI